MTQTTTAATSIAAPYRAPVLEIEPQWIDGNGHLNMAYYNVMFDRAMDGFVAEMGFGWDYIKERNLSTFTAECHVRYVREIHLEDPVQVSVFLIAADEKRVHTFEEMRHATEGWLSATSENLTLHVDMSVRKVAPFPPDIMARLQEMTAAHAAIPRPEGLGRSISMPARKPA